MPVAIRIIPISSEEAVKPIGRDGRPGPSLECGSTSLDFEARSPKPVFQRVDQRVEWPEKKPALGNYAKSPSLFAEACASRFLLQNAARSLMPSQRVSGCCRWRQAGRDCVDVWYLPEHKRARLGGLQTCGSVWMCPVCATRISEARKTDIEAALVAAEAKGWLVLMVTYTLRHTAKDSLPALLEAIASAREYAASGKQMQALREEAGFAGSVRALEVTHGENGWHPHIHELIFLRHDKSLCRFTSQLRRRWEKGLERVGIDINDHGYKMSIADCDIAAYVAKFGRDRSWNVEHELTKQPTKMGRGEGSRTPMQLLSAYALDDDRQAGYLWQQYAWAMKGKRQLSWSRNLRAELGMIALEKSDQELAEAADASGVLLAQLSGRQWATVLFFEARAELVNVASSGDADALWAFVAELQSRLTEQHARRLHHSMARSERDFEDAGRLLEEKEAADAGLSYCEYRMWRRGGITTIASEAQGHAQALAPCMSRASARRGVKYWRESEPDQLQSPKLF